MHKLIPHYCLNIYFEAFPEATFKEQTLCKMQSLQVHPEALNMRSCMQNTDDLDCKKQHKEGSLKIRYSLLCEGVTLNPQINTTR